MVEDSRKRAIMSYTSLNLVFYQKDPARLPYYGPVMRGWLGAHLFRDEYLWYNIFKNPYVDVRPYFMWTMHKGHRVELKLSLAGISERLVRDILNVISVGKRAHIGGVDAKLSKIEYEKVRIIPPDLSNEELKIRFLSPTRIEHDDINDNLPDLNTILNSISRSSNKYSKYYIPNKYPLVHRHPNIKTEIEKGVLKNVVIEHRSMNGRSMELQGVTGEITYSIRGSQRELRRLSRALALSKIFQIGKNVSYGFGKLEVCV